MLPTNDGSAVGSGESFCEEAASVVVAFKVDGLLRNDERDHDDDDEPDRDADADEEDARHKLRMSFKAFYQPPIVTLRFNINLFGHDESGKKDKTVLYFDVPPYHISSLEQTHEADIAELDHDDRKHFTGAVTRVRFLLKRPGNLVQPTQDLALKPASQRTLETMRLLASAFEFDLFMPHTTLSKEQFRCLEKAVTSPTSRHDLELQRKDHDWWLDALYGGVGGHLFNNETPAHDDSTASESGESTIATATPPAYRRSAPDDDESDVDAAGEPDNVTGDEADSPPPYDQVESEAGDAPTDMKGKQPGKRLRDSPDPDARLYRRRLFSPPVDGALCLDPVALVLSKLEQVLKKAQATEEENRSLRAELSAMRQRQDQLEDMVRRHDKRTLDLEADGAELDTRVNDIEERQAELEDRQGKTEDKCDVIEIEISDQVRSALRERLLGALETM
ncbi:hypothetical protein PG984_002898 [Apiospora sp. TS-2023a]